MKLFNVVALGKFLSENSVEMALKAYAEFYHSTSRKYQKYTQLTLIDKKVNQHLSEAMVNQLNIVSSTYYISLSAQDEVEKTYRNGSLLLLPRIINSSSIIKEAYLYGLPVLGFANSSHDNLLDASSGLRVQYQSDDQAIEQLANTLRLLKYDPDALKMLSKGAARKYENELSWGERKRGEG